MVTHEFMNFNQLVTEIPAASRPANTFSPTPARAIRRFAF